MKFKDRPEKFWDKRAAKFDRQSEFFGEPPVDKAVEYLNEEDVVLDFGCATGTVAISLATHVKHVAGIDISRKMIDSATAKATGSGTGNVDFRQASIFDPIDGHESFDAVIAFNVLHFFKNTDEVLRRVAGFLTPGGLLIVATPCMGEISFSNVLQYLLFMPLIKAGIIPYMKFFTFSALENLLHEAGFRIVEADRNTGGGELFVVAERR